MTSAEHKTMLEVYLIGTKTELKCKILIMRLFAHRTFQSVYKSTHNCVRADISI